MVRLEKRRTKPPNPILGCLLVGVHGWGWFVLGGKAVSAKQGETRIRKY